MRYLALPELDQLNALLSNIECDDGSRITGRVEAYSCTDSGLSVSCMLRQGGGDGQEAMEESNGEV